MAISEKAFNELKSDTTFTPVATPALQPGEDEKARSGIDVPGAIDDFVGDLMPRVAQGIVGGLESWRTFARGGLDQSQNITEQILGAPDTNPLPHPPGLSKETADRAKNPKTVMGKWLGGAAEGVGAQMTMPMGGGLARNIVAGMGMGEVSELTGKALGGVFGYFGGETGEKVGRATGNVIGGLVGGQANAVRMGVAKEAVVGGKDIITSAVAAARTAREKSKVAGETRGLFEIFSDEFKGMRATTKGYIQDFTNANLSKAIRRDIHASTFAESFVADSNLTGMDPKPWGLGERTMVPSITESIANVRPESHADAQVIGARATGMKRAIGEVYDKLRAKAGLPASPISIKAAAQAFQAITQAKVDGLTKEIGDVTAKFRELSPGEKGEVGQAVHNARDKMSEQSYSVAEGKYAHAEEMFDREGVEIPSGGVRDQAKEILTQFYPQVDPKSVPKVVKNILAATGKEATPLVKSLAEHDLLSSEMTAEEANRDLTLKEANDLAKALGEAEFNARGKENFEAARNARALKEKVLKSIDDSKASPEAKAAYTEARRYYSEDHAPRFQEKIGKELGKVRGGAAAGREVVPNELVLERVLGGGDAKLIDSALKEADVLFSSHPEALQKIITIGVENKFHEDVLGKTFSKDRFERDVEAFKKRYQPALDRVPEIGAKIDRESSRLYTLETEKAAEIKRYEDIMHGPVTKSVGYAQAKVMFQEALAKPEKMEELIRATKGAASKEMVKELFDQADPFRGGEYDPDALLLMLKAGKSSPDSPSSMKILFDSAFGPKLAQHHIDTLEAIARFAKRQAATDPKSLQIGQILDQSPIKEATGSSAASIISSIRAQAAGNTSSSYVAVLTLSRFVNAKMQAAMSKAMHNALYDPEMADAILEMSSKPANQAMSVTSAVKVGFDKIKDANGRNMLERMIDAGYVKDYTSRGLLYGVEATQTQERDPDSRANLRKKRREDAQAQER